MSEALKALESASRRELQALAKELQLCKGNAKSDVIVSHAMQFLDKHPKDGEQLVLNALGGSSSSTPVASPVAKKMMLKKQEKTIARETQPEDEPVVVIKSVEVIEATPSKETTTKDKKKTKSTLITKASPTTASPAMATNKTSPSSKKSPTSKQQPESVEKKEKIATKKEVPATRKKAAPVSKKAEVKARKAVEDLVKSVKDLTFVDDSRVRCSTTGHEMKADVNIINTYIHGKRYLKARNLKLSFAKYTPMFVDHPDESKTDMLWCNVTESAIARDEKRVKEHIAAPKYRKQLPIWKEEEAAKKKAEEEEAQRRAARIEAAKKRRLEAATGNGDDAVESERSIKRKRKAVVTPSPKMFGGDAALPFSRHSDVLHGPVPTNPTELENLVAELKRRGNAAFQQKALEEAEVLYTRAIAVNESNQQHNQHIFFANRSAARCSMGKAAQALEDAEACVALDSTYAKGFFRKAQALVKLGRFKEALAVLDNAKALEPSNKSVTTLYTKVQEMAKKEKDTPPAPAPKKVVTRVEVAQSTSVNSATASKATASSSTVVDEDAEVVGNVRGYKKLADGRVTTFFNNELTEEAKQLIGDIAPKKVEDPNKVQIKSVDGGSAWNQGNTFEEKDMTSWAMGKLKEIVSGISAPLGTGEGVVTSLEVSNLEGDASIAVVRGAKRYIFDFTFTLACTLKQGDSSVAGELKFLDLSSDCGGDYDVEAVVPSRYQSEGGKALHAALNSSSSPFRKALAAQLAT
ncbi:Hsp90-like protein, partial [Phytophthora palmivora]